MDGADTTEQKRIIYDPVPRYMEGVDVSDDPLLEVRTAVYLISGRIRREHINEEVQQAVAWFHDVQYPTEFGVMLSCRAKTNSQDRV